MFRARMDSYKTKLSLLREGITAIEERNLRLDRAEVNGAALLRALDELMGRLQPAEELVSALRGEFRSAAEIRARTKARSAWGEEMAHTAVCMYPRVFLLCPYPYPCGISRAVYPLSIIAVFIARVCVFVSAGVRGPPRGPGCCEAGGPPAKAAGNARGAGAEGARERGRGAGVGGSGAGAFASAVCGLPRAVRLHLALGNQKSDTHSPTDTHPLPTYPCTHPHTHNRASWSRSATPSACAR